MRSLNEEQETAVKTCGNILLKAGAGSGKTFVLVHHMLFLLENFLNENKTLENAIFIKSLKHYLSGMALITFTKKAAGELELRLRQEIVEKAQCQGQKWIIVQQHLDSLTVGTIHSFFLKLLRQGYFPECGENFPIITGNYKIKKKIRKILNNWLDKEFPKHIQETKKPIPLWAVVSDIKKLEAALKKIFESPHLRGLWEEEFSEEEKDESIWNRILYLLEFDKFLADQFSFPKPKKSVKWFNFYCLFEDLKKKTPLTLDSASQYINFFNGDQSKNLRAPKGNNKIESYFKKAKELREFLKNNEDHLVNYNEKETRDWREIFRKIFHYVSHRYNFIQEFSYADIEYYTLKGLLNPRNRERVKENIRYIVIDEFQDVSKVQYDILKHIIGDDFERIYCVGDEKQAVYGFRGGDCEVFFDVDRHVKNRLSLKMNYRSTEKIIRFNNMFFNKIFKRETVSQEFPSSAESSEVGVIRYQLEIESTGDKKPLKSNQKTLDAIEAVKIYEIITASLEKYPNQKTCVLYKNLKASLHLIDALLDGGKSFQAQIKIPEGEDPMLAIFKAIIEGALEKDKDHVKRYCIFIVTNILKHLNFFGSVEESIERFYKNMSIIGLRAAFRTFILELGIHNCNYENNLKMIEEIISSNFEDVDSIYQEILELTGKYSIDFYVEKEGKESSQVILMTVHASKGLEFDHVILGGIHTNGISNHEIEMLGKTSKSFRWKKQSSEKTLLKTPSLILEEIVKKKEELAESQRILYVACTRAKKRLSWVDIHSQGKNLSYSSNSWITKLRGLDEEIDCIVEQRPLSDFKLQKNKNAPFFHNDGLGLALVEGKKELVGHFSSLSVSRMSYLEQCPRKFYLKNLCGLDDDNDFVIKYNEEKTLEREGSGFVSTQNARERGIEIHKIISEAIKSDFVKKADFQTYKSIDWTITHIKKIRESSTLSSEESVQLDFFGNIVTGIVDLICFPQLIKEKIRIVDFKTGKRTENSENVYWFQLISYAYAVYQKYPDYQPIFLLEICYVDEKQFIVKEMQFKDIKKYLFHRWFLLTSLNQINENHCRSCCFGKICH